MVGVGPEPGALKRAAAPVQVAVEVLPVPRPWWHAGLQRDHLLTAVLGLGSVVLVMWLVRQVPDWGALQQWGLFGVLLANLIGSASILLPVPGFAVVAAAGAIWPAPVVGLVSGIGSATGELTGYLAGRGSGALLGGDANPHLRRVHAWLARYGFWAILAVAVMPFPPFDLAGVAAGATRYPVFKFWVACAIGKAIKLTVWAALGAWLLSLLPF